MIAAAVGRVRANLADLARGLFALYLLMLVVWGSQPDARGHLVAALGIAIAGLVGVMALGLPRVLLFLAIVLAVTLTIENIGVATGLPFGHYHFQASQFSLWVGRVPLLVGMLYFGVGLLSWLVAGILLEERGQAMLRPVIAAGLMVLWDLVMDPSFSTIGRVWVWHEGGAFFGVPLLNFAGWFLTTWIMFQIFALALRRLPEREPPGRALHSAQRAATLLYMGIGLSPMVPFFTPSDTSVVDGAGQVWLIHHIRGISALLGLCTMGLVSAVALTKLQRSFH
ncbi:MAG: carotenoid biosynthesis protein [Rhizomicrobium sp.]